MEKIKHQGKAPFNPDPEGYKVFRNVEVRLIYLRLVMRESADVFRTIVYWRRCSWRYGFYQVSAVDFDCIIWSSGFAITSQNRCGGGTRQFPTYGYHSTLLFYTFSFFRTSISPLSYIFRKGAFSNKHGFFLLQTWYIWPSQEIPHIGSNRALLLHSIDWRCQSSSNFTCGGKPRWICGYWYVSSISNGFFTNNNIHCFQDANPDIPGGGQYFRNTNNLWAPSVLLFGVRMSFHFLHVKLLLDSKFRDRCPTVSFPFFRSVLFLTLVNQSENGRWAAFDSQILILCLRAWGEWQRWFHGWFSVQWR